MFQLPRPPGRPPCWCRAPPPPTTGPPSPPPPTSTRPSATWSAPSAHPSSTQTGGVSCWSYVGSVVSDFVIGDISVGGGSSHLIYVLFQTNDLSFSRAGIYIGTRSSEISLYAAASLLVVTLSVIQFLHGYQELN